ncbi:INO80 complex subunit C [Malassezia restricta]|uniref:Chromatin-remodeling complex subunit ies6 n=1 Tax=Malassezia restricta (strain ATCC 96810 / NBRC 103918 / CBS 7877) TaxID=425264 RepID=A0A3G2S946_MALR7|nr:INO80 complex subunit C [Malassezia restricta]AXA49962.1 INO80 complex subunit C [Malassezia restricta]AYO42577.1 Chromatin-remodeling complex subunit ies6 [Malassezia restricta CBS 7877]
MSEPGLTSEDLSVYVDKHPFKSEAYLQKMGANGAPVPSRRNKPLKQILNQEREAYYQKRGMVDPTKKRGDSTPKRRKTEQEADSEVPAPREEGPLRDVPTYTSVQAPPSLLPPKRYCDLTGLMAPYTDPKTRLRYHSAEVYQIIKGFAPGADNAYLALRGDASQLL